MLEKPEIRYRDFVILDNFIEKVLNVKKNSSCSIAIESKWGNGKTEFIKSWEKHLRAKGIKTIYYDAWQYDNVESPLLPLLVKIAESVEDKDDKAFISYAKELLRTTYFSTAKYLSEKAFGKDSAVEKILTEGIDALKDHEIKDYYKELEKEYSTMKTLSEKLMELIQKSDQNIYILIDELDHCRPDFAIKTLELINHFFNFYQITYIFALDVEQLSFSIQNVYGEKLDSFMYMRKFFDIIYRLSNPDINTYIEDVLQKNVPSLKSNQEMSKYICSLLRQFNLSLQDINYICKHIGIFLDHYKKQLNSNQNAIKYYLYFLVIRHLNYIDYQNIIHGNYSFKRDANLFERIQTKIPEKLNVLFQDLSDGGGLKNREDIIDKFGLIQPTKVVSFYEYIESVMNYSIVFANSD